MVSMPKYNVPGRVRFVATAAHKHFPYFNNYVCSLILLDSIAYYWKKLGFEILGDCIMPNHVYILIWWEWQKNKELDISTILHRIKGRSVKMIFDYISVYGYQGFYAVE